jgi:hypothetical protein
MPSILLSFTNKRETMCVDLLSIAFPDRALLCESLLRTMLKYIDKHIYRSFRKYGALSMELMIKDLQFIFHSYSLKNVVVEPSHAYQTEGIDYLNLLTFDPYLSFTYVSDASDFSDHDSLEGAFAHDGEHRLSIFQPIENVDAAMKFFGDIMA